MMCIVLFIFKAACDNLFCWTQFRFSAALFLTTRTVSGLYPWLVIHLNHTGKKINLPFASPRVAKLGERILVRGYMLVVVVTTAFKLGPVPPTERECVSEMST